MADRWFRFEAEEIRGERRIVLRRRAVPATGNPDIDLWRDPGTLYTLQEPGEPPTLPLALLDDLLRLLPPEAARSVVRAYLARDPEAAAKVAGAWAHPDDEHSVRRMPGRRDEVAWVQPFSPARGGGFLWIARPLGTDGRAPTRAEAEAAVDALLTAEGWVLGVGEVERG